MSTFAERAFNFYQDQGLSPAQAAALVGHAIAESGGSPTIKERLAGGKTGPGYGLYQWTSPSRKQGLYDFAAQNQLDPDAEETQLLYSLHELRTTEKAAGDKLFAAKTYKEAVDAGMDYLRPSGYSAGNPSGGHNYTGRYNTGAQLVGEATIDSAPTVITNSAPRSPSLPPSLLLGDGGAAANAAAAAEAARREREAEAANQSLIKDGLGLLAQATMPAPRLAAPMQAPRPQVTPPGNPDFTQILAQQRLQRRF